MRFFSVRPFNCKGNQDGRSVPFSPPGVLKEQLNCQETIDLL